MTTLAPELGPEERVETTRLAALTRPVFAASALLVVGGLGPVSAITCTIHIGLGDRK